MYVTSENETFPLNLFDFLNFLTRVSLHHAIRKQREIFCLIAFQLLDFLLSRRAPRIDRVSGSNDSHVTGSSRSHIRVYLTSHNERQYAKWRYEGEGKGDDRGGAVLEQEEGTATNG